MIQFIYEQNSSLSNRRILPYNINQKHSEMRVYTTIDRLILSSGQWQEYSFIIITHQIHQYEDWVVTHITFNNYKQHNSNSVILSIWIYYFALGFKMIQLVYQISHISKVIVLNFKLKQNTEELPYFEENGKEKFLTNVISRVKKQFNGKKYIQNIRDMNRFIERLMWEPELKTTVEERQQMNKSLQIKPIVPVSIALVLGIAVASYFKYK